MRMRNKEGNDIIVDKSMVSVFEEQGYKVQEGEEVVELAPEPTPMRGDYVVMHKDKKECMCMASQVKAYEKDGWKNVKEIKETSTDIDPGTAAAGSYKNPVGGNVDMVNADGERCSCQSSQVKAMEAAGWRPAEGEAVTETTLRSAVEALDPANDDHWTKAGKPNVDVISEVLGDKVTRRMVDTAWPGYERPAVEA